MYQQEKTIDKYLYQTGLPELSEFTVHFWLNIAEKNLPYGDTLVSIESPGQY